MTEQAVASSLAAVVTLSSVAANLLPHESENKFLSVLIHLIRFLALNFDVRGMKR
jgi:hypothetical protein